MVFKKFVIAVAVFVLFVGGAFTAYQVADLGQNAAADEPKNVTNETVVQEFDSFQFVDQALEQYTTGFNDSVTAYNSSNTTLERGTDYRWNETDGTILYLDTQSTNETNTSYVSYTYFENTQEVKEVSGPIETVTNAIGQTGFLAAGLALVVLILLFGGFIASRLTNGMPKTNR